MDKSTTKPLAKKLGIKSGDRMYVHHPPDNYWDLLGEISDEIILLTDPESNMDFVHVFSRKMKDLEVVASELRPNLKKDGMLWVSWPKGSAGIETDIKRDQLRDYILSLEDLVDVKVASINDIWSGLKFVYRLKDR